MKLKSLPVVALALALACVVASGTPAPGRVAASEASYPVTERSFAVGDGYVQTISHFCPRMLTRPKRRAPRTASSPTGSRAERQSTT